MTTFPYLEVSGDHKDLGWAIGETFRNEIKKHVKFFIEAEKRNDATPYLLETKKIFPELIEELAAMAEAAAVPFNELFLVNTREIDDHDHCTSVVGFSPDGAIIGHNEDWLTDSIDDLYILKAVVNGIGFLGLHYNYELPGTSATLNSYGLAQCINEVYARPAIGVPKNFLSRAVLECKTLDQAENFLRLTKRAGGFNHVLVQGEEIRNLETNCSDVTTEKTIKRPYAHTNHYLSPKMRIMETARSESSLRRLEKVSQLLKDNMTKNDLAAILSDTSDLDYPICNEKVTIGSVIMLPAKNEVWICRGHPCTREYTKYKL